MKTILLPLSLALVAAPVTAQMTTKMNLDTDAGQLSTANSKTDFKSSKKGTVIPPITWTYRLRTSVTTGSGSTARNSMQTLWASTNHDGNGGSMGMSGLTRGTSADKSYLTPSLSQSGKPGAVGFLMEMTNKAGTKGAIRLTWQTLFKQKATSTATLDIGNNQSIDWTGKDTKGGIATVTLPAQFDQNGKLRLRLTMNGSQEGAGQFVYSSLYSRLTVKFINPQSSSCKVTAYGQGCQGAQAAGAVLSLGNEHVITLKMTGGFRNAHVIEAIGNRQMNLPLPGGCALLSNAPILLLHKTDAKGEFTHIRKASKFLNSISYHQYLPITLRGNQLLLKASNGLKIVCVGAR